jgi:DNA-binding LacI/PurR family transcriptional regulator
MNELVTAVYEAARRAGRRVPEDVAVISFNETTLASHSSPSLSVLRVSPRPLASEAVRMLTAAIEGRGPAQGVVMPYGYIRRGSMPGGNGNL